MPKFEFRKALENFVFHTIFTRQEAIAASCSVQFECSEAREKFLLHFPVSKAVRMEEFEQAQIQTIQQSSSFLKVSYFCSCQLTLLCSLVGLKISDGKFAYICVIVERVGSISMKLIIMYTPSRN